MIDISKVSIGQKVHYKPGYFLSDEFENGIIKEIPNHSTDSVRVVYHVPPGEWKNYKNYTSALTNVRDLYLGWKHKEVKIDEDGCID